MTRYILRRAVAAVATLLVVSLIIFLAARVAGDPRRYLLSDNATPEQYQLLAEQLGLDQPLHVQYATFLSQIAAGDFGRSISQQRRTFDVVIERIPATLLVAVTAFTFAFVVGIGLGVVSATRRGTRSDRWIQVVAVTGQAVPSFWLGIVLIFVFAVHLRWLPPSGMREWSSFILPSLALGWYFVAANLRLTRSSMLDVLGTEYIKMARAKGLPRRQVIWKHGLRNALIPPLTFAGVTLGTLVTGSLVIETVFAWPGLGKLAIDAVFASDYPLLQGVVIVFTVLYMTAALLVDTLYAILDPRVRLA
jgi:peptide/nickel transport system permease protein